MTSCGLTQQQLKDFNIPNDRGICKGLLPDGVTVCNTHITIHSQGTAGVSIAKDIHSSLYILCSENFDEVVGTAFVISTTTVLTAHHNMVVDPTITNPKKVTLIHKGTLVKRVRRIRNYFDSDSTIIIPVEIKKVGRKFIRNFGADWMLLQRTDGNEFPTSEIVEICPEQELPDRTEKLYVYHSPVELFMFGQIDNLGILISEKGNGFYSNHKIFIQNGLYRGSSGGAYVTRNGKVVAMHTDSTKGRKSVEEVTDENPGFSEIECLTNASDSHAHSYASLAEGVLLCKFPDILRYA